MKSCAKDLDFVPVKSCNFAVASPAFIKMRNFETAS